MGPNPTDPEKISSECNGMPAGLARINSPVVPRCWEQWCWDTYLRTERKTPSYSFYSWYFLSLQTDSGFSGAQPSASGGQKNTLHWEPAVLHRPSLFPWRTKDLIKLIDLLCLQTCCFPLQENWLKIWTGKIILWKTGYCLKSFIVHFLCGKNFRSYQN